MPLEGWTNLSIKKERMAKFKRMFDTISDKQFEWVDWVSNILESSLLREKFVKENFPYIRFVGNVKNGCVLEDTRTKAVVNVTIKGSKITSMPHGEQYVLYAMLTPRLLLE